MATPTICSPCGPYFFCRSTNDGISILQGSHHVAQKFTNTALPRSDDSFTSLPSGRLFSAKSGATEPLCGSRNSGGGALSSFFASPGFAACCTPDGCATLRSITLPGRERPFTAINTPVTATTRERIRTTLLSTRKSSKNFCYTPLSAFLMASSNFDSLSKPTISCTTLPERFTKNDVGRPPTPP